VFGRPINATDVVHAIASYERTQFSFDSPFDHFMAGDKTAISESLNEVGTGVTCYREFLMRNLVMRNAPARASTPKGTRMMAASTGLSGIH
jgi:uncharacterized protein YbaP (TraB family)